MRENGSAIAAEPLLLDGHIENFTNWIRDAVISRKSLSLERKIFLSSIVILSLCASGSAFMLGKKFGENLQSENSIVQVVLGLYFAASSFIPVAASSAISAVSICADLTRIRPDSEKKLRSHHDHTKPFLFFYYMYIIYVACTASISDVYNTGTQFYPSLKLAALLFIIPDVLIAPLFNAFYFQELNKSIYSDIRGLFANKKPPVNYKKEIIAKLKNKINDISALSEEEAFSILNGLLIDPEKIADLSQQELAQKTSWFFSSSQLNPQEGVDIDQSIGKTLFGIAGSTISAVGAFAFFYSLSQGGAEVICNYFDIQNEETKNAINDISSSSVIMAKVALAAYTNRISFEKYYVWFSKLPEKIRELIFWLSSFLCGNDNTQLNSNNKNDSRCKTFVNMLTIILAASSTASRAELVIQTYGTADAKGRFFIASTFIGTFGTRFWSIDTLIKKLMDRSSSRNILLECVNKVIDVIPKLTDNQLIAIHKKFFENVSASVLDTSNAISIN